MDGGYLSSVLPRARGCVSVRRPRGSGVGAACARPAQTAGRRGADENRRSLASVARRGGTPSLGLLSRGEEARRGAGSARWPAERAGRQESDTGKDKEEKEEWLNSTDRALSRAQAAHASLSSFSTATAPMATISSTSGAPGKACCRMRHSLRRTRRVRADRRPWAASGFRSPFETPRSD